jgi:hypothetical protein
MSKLESSVVRQLHAAFAVVTGAGLEDGRVSGLSVQVTRQVPALRLDLFARPTMQLAVNPNWARSQRPSALRQALASAALDEIV